jgi:hypothetical protein
VLAADTGRSGCATGRKANGLRSLRVLRERPELHLLRGPKGGAEIRAGVNARPYVRPTALERGGGEQRAGVNARPYVRPTALERGGGEQRAGVNARPYGGQRNLDRDGFVTAGIGLAIFGELVRLRGEALVVGGDCGRLARF